MSSGDARNSALHAASAELRSRHAEILDANAIDMREAGERGLSAAMLDRLMLDESRIEAMAAGLEAIAGLPDPLGRVMAEWQRPNGLNIQRVAVPLGVIGIIYESRPNVTADAAGLCVKSGNAVILRGGSESFHSSRAIHACLVSGLEKAGLPADCVQMVPTTDRAAVGYVPVIGHLEGICHVYLHEAADAAMAAEIAVNAKMRRTGICGAAETLLVDRGAAARLLPGVLTALRNAGCEIRGDSDVVEFFPEAKQASEDDWGTEYLDAILSVRVVDDIDAAIQHISEYGSGHTECIVTNDDGAAGKFFRNVDSAILLQNASTQFADGGDRIHARGPVGAEQLTSYKYVVRGSGQTRP
jgi:glutamate-5-semialdehyde dehydrogenase